ncbi:class I SAM-dependent methyltransferase [Spirosoma sp. BT704]|uniref:Class I SAM-dependent methyltransferase n=2 Tax=Spirosoma validum TaxID=2771355 RepID=A0A927B064_9BACT|nr:class I SAM-dependent methyltransferase [Spirosoma validum]
MKSIPGTKGYADVAPKFIEATTAIDFTKLHQDFLPFIPKVAGRILDLGAGIGRDAFEFSQRGHSVVAVEPTEEFRIVGKKLYHSPMIDWIDDCLPKLSLLSDQANQFDFILASGVWYHLDDEEQAMAMERIASLLKINDIVALSLRHGPPGAGSHFFPTSGRQTIQDAYCSRLTTLMCIENQPSLMQHKEKVSWTRLVCQKQER